jgi:NAD(P)-dependent dehydrogenase (short-subunit alcohol dehydrogenase family)
VRFLYKRNATLIKAAAGRMSGEGEPVTKKMRSEEDESIIAVSQTTTGLNSGLGTTDERVNGDGESDPAHPTASGGLELEELSISQADLETTLRVLNAIVTKVKSGGTKKEELTKSFDKYYRQNASLRPIRKAIGPLVDLHQKVMFHGKSEGGYLKDKDHRIQLKRQRHQETNEQRKYLNTTQLRRTRIENLNALKDQGKDEEESKLLAYLVPDGAVDTHAPGSESLGNGSKLLCSATDTKHDSGTTTSILLLDGGAQGESKDDPEAIITNSSEIMVQLPKLRSCYVCKQRFRELHHFYDQLCPPCAKFNFDKRNFSVDLTGYVAVVTGARVKIGFHTCLKLLRAGCTVIATTRFPNAACQAYLSQPDAASFQGKLHVYGLDLRDVTGLEAFTRFLKQRYEKIDIIINNACQTIRRPAGYYRPAVQEEQRLYKDASTVHHSFLTGGKAYEALRRKLNTSHTDLRLESSSVPNASVLEATTAPEAIVSTGDGISSDVVDIQTTTTLATENNDSNGMAMTQELNSTSVESLSYGEEGVAHSALMSQMTLLPEDVGVDQAVMPEGLKDINGQQLDLRRHNSWLLKMEDVSTPEVVETMFVNVIAPFVLNARLKPLMLEGGSGRPDRFIVNVSAMEGKFYRFKTPNHPHTNMAKAALNMMTRTSAEDWAKKCRIYMNSVDTGWINDENPLEKAANIAKLNHFQTPIDEIDAASRILDPIFASVSGQETPPKYGLFFKDYKPTEW